MTASAPVLSVSGYSLDYRTSGGYFRALEAVDIAIASGETLGLVGESGSGKTSLAWAIMRHLPASARESGAIALGDTRLMALDDQGLGDIRGRRIGMVFQDPSTSLNPTLTLGEQVAEVITRHRGAPRKEAWQEAEAMLARVGLKTPSEMMRRYPHEASGGEKQRVVIAGAFVCKPECILFDEPTTALDVITARQILDLFAELQQETKVAALYISHDLALVSRIASRIAVIHRGRIVEQGATEDVFARPQHDYTRKLLAAVPRPDVRLTPEREAGGEAPLIEAKGLSVRFDRASLFDRIAGRRRAANFGARDVSFAIAPGEILGVVGESGSGKSTIARAMTGLNPFDGELRLSGRTISGAGDMDKAYRRAVQIIFQHPDSSLNPRQRIGEILSRPLALYGEATGRSRDAAIGEMLEQVRLPADYAARYPHQLSGGEKQRVAIARAFASRPQLVICDEITSALDVSVQASVIELLIELRRTSGAAYLFITHDLNLIRQIADRLVVMYRGDLVETIDVATLAQQGAQHAYTRSLMAAVPAPAGSPSI